MNIASKVLLVAGVSMLAYGTAKIIKHRRTIKKLNKDIYQGMMDLKNEIDRINGNVIDIPKDQYEVTAQ